MFLRIIVIMSRCEAAATEQVRRKDECLFEEDGSLGRGDEGRVIGHFRQSPGHQRGNTSEALRDIININFALLFHSSYYIKVHTVQDILPAVIQRVNVPPSRI